MAHEKRRSLLPDGGQEKDDEVLQHALSVAQSVFGQHLFQASLLTVLLQASPCKKCSWTPSWTQPTCRRTCAASCSPNHTLHILDNPHMPLGLLVFLGFDIEDELARSGSCTKGRNSPRTRSTMKEMKWHTTDHLQVVIQPLIILIQMHYTFPPARFLFVPESPCWLNVS